MSYTQVIPFLGNKEIKNKVQFSEERRPVHTEAFSFQNQWKLRLNLPFHLLSLKQAKSKTQAFAGECTQNNHLCDFLGLQYKRLHLLIRFLLGISNGHGQ